MPLYSASCITSLKSEDGRFLRATVTGILIACFLVFASVKPAHASLFVSITSGATTDSCNNSLAVSATNCVAGLFTTTMNSNSLIFIGTVGGFSISTLSLNSNAPGDSSFGYDTTGVINVTNTNSSSASLTVDFSTFNMTLPTGLLSLSGSDSASWNKAAAGDNQALTVYGNPSNSLTGGTATLTASPCVSPSSVAPPQSTTQCSGGTPPQVATFTNTSSYALNAVDTISMEAGGIGSYTAGVNANAVPEPGTYLMLGLGLSGLAYLLQRRKRSS